ncbi:HlyD family secretion protein [Bradyrhizobium sp.]|uniref:HlyD family secretion protein n=1 Tax=Bradyrhizobium sp. TaxID=376 RepID=UPI00238990E5|nr:HlyD family efflux transporter periplasmic adaptor subunit [Bradyrhizobium sp.]MDE1936754.1 HlyD family efflux transporter periplasmic adaptor subunit [Bradyrhizobium sp.]
MSRRFIGILTAAIGAGIIALPITYDATSKLEVSAIAAAHAQPRIKNLIARLRGAKLPEGIARSNGRLEATQVDVSAKYAGRISEVNVEEGSPVKVGQVVGKISSPEMEAQLRAAQASVQKAKDAVAAAEAEIATRQSALEFAKGDFDRAVELIKSGNITKQIYDQRQRNFEGAQAATAAVQAQRDQARSAVSNATAEVERIQAMLADLTLVSPREGRVQYQLAHAGEVVAAGAPILTILDLTDVYMTIFLPAAVAGKLEVGGEARLVLDPIPDTVIPATVSFVAADAQFTPKTVETKDEREKLMFRVKLKVNPDLLRKYISRVKTGVRGIGFVRTNADVAWPESLQVKPRLQ